MTFPNLLATHGGAEEPLLVLTDEELASVSPDRPHDHEPVPLRALAGLSEEAVDAVRSSALRSLAARGWVRVGDDGPELRDALAIVTAARAEAISTTVAVRSSGDGEAALVLYATGDGPTLTDQVADGVHVLHLVDRADAIVALATFLDPDERAGQATDGRILEGDVGAPPAEWVTIQEQAGGQAATVVSQVGDQVRELAVFPAADGPWVVGGFVDGAGELTRVRAVQLGPTSLVMFLAALVSGEDVTINPEDDVTGAAP